MKVLASYLAFSDTVQWGLRVPLYGFESLEFQAPHWVFAGRGVDKATVFLFVFLWCLEQSSDCLKVFQISGLPFSLSFGQRQHTFVGILFVCACWHFWVAGFFIYNSGIFQGKKETQETYHGVVPWIPVHQPVCLLSNLESSCVCFIYNVNEFYIYLAGGTGRVCLLCPPRRKSPFKDFFWLY